MINSLLLNALTKLSIGLHHQNSMRKNLATPRSRSMAFASTSTSAATTTTFLLLLLHSSCFFPLLLAKSKHSTTHSHSHAHSDFHSNPRLHQAYLALHAWKQVIYSDPKNFTTNWVGPNVCDYFGIFCSPSRDDPHVQVVAGIDLNHGDIAGFLPDELGLLSDLALIHLNSNRFCGILPLTLSNLTLLFELDLSTNRFVGKFPSVILSLPSLKYLDLRFNEFEGPLPPQLFNLGLDAIFVNNNRLYSVIPPSLTSATASVVVFANNNFGGCLPEGISKLADHLEELLLINTNLSGCLPWDVGLLYKIKVFDVSFNNLVGSIPYSVAGMVHVEQLNLAHNKMTGAIPAGVCALPNLMNFNASYNFFCEEEGLCLKLKSKGVSFDDRRNCLPERPRQRRSKECDAALQHPVDCFEYHCESGNGGRGQNMVGVGAPAPSPSTHS